MSLYKEIFPPIENLLEMEPEELGIFVLRHLSVGGKSQLNRYNYALGSSPEFIEWAGQGQGREKVKEKLMVAWMWLEKELFIAPKPGEQGEWVFITEKGIKVLEGQDFDTYKKSNLLPSDGLDPILVRKVKPSFIRGDYEMAVLQAFKEIEVRVRAKAKLGNEDIGVKLMRRAFKSPDGPLTDTEATPGEQQATMDLFAGAIGSFKNPSSHRNVNFTDPKEAADLIHMANQLLRMVDAA